MSKKVSLFAVLLAAIICLATMAVYLRGTLGGNINFHFLPAKMFGVPEDLARRGVVPLYFGVKETGWDGQFYYYMSNDLLALKDTPKHIDAPSYRYQRIGLSLYAAVVAHLTGQGWVSPLSFYLSYLMLVLLAVWAASKVLQLRGGLGVESLLWVAGVGTQVTLLNALPDAAADAFLILATLALLYSRYWIGAILLAMAALARESYVLFPLAFISWALGSQLLTSSVKARVSGILEVVKRPQVYSLFLPVCVFGVWQVYIRVHFGIAPSEQATNILGPPFVEWWRAMTAGLSGHHYLVPEGVPSVREGVSQVFFMALLFLTLALGVAVLRRGKDVHEWVRALALGGGGLALLYICFGRTVAMHYTGYMKAANLFLFLIPLFMLHAELKPLKRGLSYVLLFGAVGYTVFYLWDDRILPKPYSAYAKYVRASEVTRTDEASCLARFDVDLKLVGIEDAMAPAPLAFLAPPRSEVFWVDLTNKSGESFAALHGKGSVNMSYHWMAKDGTTVVKDGIRSMIPEGVRDGQTVRVPVVVEYPTELGVYTLRLTPVQEGCAWFYMANPHSAMDIDFVIR